MYFKVRNAGGESAVKSDTVTLNEAAPVLATFSINSGAASTTSQIVKLNNTYTGGVPTHYMASESSSFTGATWKTWSTAPSLTLSAGNGTKTVYLKVKNASGGSAVKYDTIVLN
jgi:hypothetical protein